MNLVIIDYNAGNVQSVKFALQRLGVEATLSNDKHTILKADKVLFPGVGEASYAMQQLQKYDLHRVIPHLTQPVLGICLGMQLMCSYSEENDTSCLNIFSPNVKKFDPIHKVPHMGWNQLYDLKGTLYKKAKEDDYTYFVHSYYVPICDDTSARSSYGIDFSASLEKGNFHATQFHPEKSGKFGEQIIKNFLEL